MNDIISHLSESWFFQGEVASTIELLGVPFQGTDRDEHTTERGNRQRHDQGYRRLRQINQNEGSWGFFFLVLPLLSSSIVSVNLNNFLKKAAYTVESNIYYCLMFWM